MLITYSWKREHMNQTICEGFSLGNSLSTYSLSSRGTEFVNNNHMNKLHNKVNVCIFLMLITYSLTCYRAHLHWSHDEAVLKNCEIHWESSLTPFQLENNAVLHGWPFLFLMDDCNKHIVFYENRLCMHRALKAHFV